MSKREIVRQFSISAEIYELDLAQKILESLREDMPALGENLLFGLDIVFDRKVYQKAEFFQYPITKEHKGPQPRTQQEKTKQIIYDVLSEQLDKVAGAMGNLGFHFGNTAIIGEDTVSNQVQIILYQEEPMETPKGKKQTRFRVNSIIPDRPYVIEQGAKALAEFFLRQAREGKLHELMKEKHTANWVTADKLFTAIAGALNSERLDVTAIKSKLLREALMESEWPLRMRSRTRNDTAELITEETEIDCPEYLIFRLTTGGSWDMGKVEGLQEAQQIIVKHGFKSKRFKSIVVLHNQIAVPYSLFAETDEGLAFVTPEEAHNFKKLHVSWNKMK